MLNIAIYKAKDKVMTWSTSVAIKLNVLDAIYVVT